METDPRYEVIIYWSAEDEAFISEWIETAQETW